MRSTCIAAVLSLVFMLAAQAACAEPLNGTKPLTAEGDLASQMVEGIDRFLLKQTALAKENRARHWKRDTSSPETYNASIEPNRARLRKIIGAHDERVPFDALELVATTDQPALVGRGDGFEVYAVRWPVLPGVHGEGLLLKPVGREPVADAIALPDADQSPEMLVGLVPGIAPESQFARRLAERGVRVVVPTLIDRADTYSITRAGRGTNQPHREFVYRPAFEMGRHIIGYEVQKALALVDWFTKEAASGDPRIGITGYGEGGLVALYAAALDPRIDTAFVSGYFGPREGLWQEPIYRNVFALLDEFGDAELASMVAPRELTVEASRAPEVAGPPQPRPGRSGAAPGVIATPSLEDVEKELERARQLVPAYKDRLKLVVSDGGNGPFGVQVSTAPPGATPTHLRKNFDSQVRLKRQLEELLEHTQVLMREAEYVRDAFWSKADRTSHEKYAQTVEPYREYFYNEVIGRFDLPLGPFNARSRQVYDMPKYTGYEVQLDVFDDVFAYGILLVPKDIEPGERRPVVVCQHGLEGRPQDVADPNINHRAYHQYGCQLAERGFVVYAPQNPYIFEDRFRTLQRKANPLKKSLFSIIVPQHQQTLNWLSSLPMVDPQRIGFYGLSYGGKTAMRVPALVPNYALSICSADFNEWIWKNASLRASFSYVGTKEYEIFEFDLGNTFNYMEMAALIAPRPFMVERGHHDGVGPDHWVGYEFGKVRHLYADLKIPDRATIEFFDGPHMINGVGTFEFLHHHLRWPHKKQ
jgi:dienelactone hydrolase